MSKDLSKICQNIHQKIREKIRQYKLKINSKAKNSTKSKVLYKQAPIQTNFNKKGQVILVLRSSARPASEWRA